jgi:hypothetical protein
MAASDRPESGPAPTDPDAYGKLIYSVRPTPGVRAVTVVAALLLVIGAFVWLTNDHSWWLAAAGVVGAGIAVTAICLAGFVEKHRVHEHVLLLGPTWPGATPYVVPLASVDPDTVTSHLRANHIPKRLNNNGLPTMRCAIYTTRAVSLVGLSYEAALAGRNPADSHAHQVMGGLYGRTEMPREAASRWVLGVRRPRPLLDALETAFAADGRPQPGLAARVDALPVVEPSGRPQET